MVSGNQAYVKFFIHNSETEDKWFVQILIYHIHVHVTEAYVKQKYLIDYLVL